MNVEAKICGKIDAVICQNAAIVALSFTGYFVASCQDKGVTTNARATWCRAVYPVLITVLVGCFIATCTRARK